MSHHNSASKTVDAIKYKSITTARRMQGSSRIAKMIDKKKKRKNPQVYKHQKKNLHRENQLIINNSSTDSSMHIVLFMFNRS
jgi:hypothetical protein